MAGIGNCASALVQGIEYYKDVGDDDFVPGIMHANFGGYQIRDIRFVAAFDVNRSKIGRDLNEAIFADPNCCFDFAEVPRLGVEVLPGPILDGVAPHMREPFHVYDGEENEAVDVTKVLRETEADMLVNFLPVGSRVATRYYADACLEARCALVNCIPEFIASDPAWAKRFGDAGLPVVGDDIKSQVGATIVHRALIETLVNRGVKIDETYQMNIGGNTDFLNMTVEGRLVTKRESKTKAITSLVPYDVPTRIGPSDYVSFLKDTKIAHIYIKGRNFGDLPISMDLTLRVNDSPNSAGVVVDVIRATKLALDRGISGPLVSISSYSFKHPPVKVPDDIARTWVEKFIRGKRKW